MAQKTIEDHELIACILRVPARKVIVLNPQGAIEDLPKIESSSCIIGGQRRRIVRVSRRIWCMILVCLQHLSRDRFLHTSNDAVDLPGPGNRVG
jgi:hypothetical protein